MNRTYSNLRPLVAFFSVVAVILTTTGATSVTVAASSFEGAPIVTIDGGAVRGVAVAGGYAFRALRRCPNWKPAVAPTPASG